MFTCHFTYCLQNIKKLLEKQEIIFKKKLQNKSLQMCPSNPISILQWKKKNGVCIMNLICYYYASYSTYPHGDWPQQLYSLGKNNIILDVQHIVKTSCQCTAGLAVAVSATSVPCGEAHIQATLSSAWKMCTTNMLLRYETRWHSWGAGLWNL